MADARPSKVGAAWRSKVIGSTSTAFIPPLAKARPSVAPAMPAPAMITSAVWVSAMAHLRLQPRHRLDRMTPGLGVADRLAHGLAKVAAFARAEQFTNGEALSGE